MREKEENKLDRFFKDGISGSEDHISFREEDWTSMEQLLDNKSGKKAIVFRFIYYASAIAALLLLAAGIYFYNSGTDQINSSIKKSFSRNNRLHPQLKDSNTKHLNDKQEIPQQAAPQNLVNGSNHVLKSTPLLAVPGNNKNYSPFKAPATGSGINEIAAVKTSNTVIDDKQSPISSMHEDNAIATDTTDKSKLASQNNNSQTGIIAANSGDTTTTKAERLKENKVRLAVKSAAIKSRPQFSISILAAPDVNAVNSFNRSQVGSNFGVQLSLRLTKKLIVSTGAAYAIKPYSTNYGSYNSPTYNPSIAPTNIQANCKVLDIPLNLSYQLYTRGNDAIAIGTGLSSYFMLKENYRFDYTDQTGKKPYNLVIKNQNTHLFGVINVNVNYQRRINSKFSAVVQPYMKLPITGIGNGNVDLKSTGVALGVNWNISSILKR